MTESVQLQHQKQILQFLLQRKADQWTLPSVLASELGIEPKDVGAAIRALNHQLRIEVYEQGIRLTSWEWKRLDKLAQSMAAEAAEQSSAS